MSVAAKWFIQPHDRVASYCCWDVWATARLTQELEEELASGGWSGGTPSWYRHHVWPLVGVVLEMQARGIGVSRERLHGLRSEMRQQLAETDQRIRVLAGRDLNPDSPRDLAHLLFDEMGLKAATLTDKGHRSTSMDALLRVYRGLRKRDEAARPLLEALMHRSRLRTMLRNHLSFEPDPDDRVRPIIKVAGTETGRLAYANPPLQQFPPEVRRVFVAKPGHVFVAADYSQLELRILAYLSRDPLLIRTFEEGGDPHAANARDLFGLTQEQWDALDPATRKRYRSFAKTWIYGIGYGGNPLTIKTKAFCPCPLCRDRNPDTVNLGRRQIEEAAQRWFAAHLPVLAFRKRLQSEITRKRVSTNPFGRRRKWYGPWSAIKREAYNWPMQSTAADLMIGVMGRLGRRGVPLVLQMHDSLMAEVPESLAMDTAKILAEEMEAFVPTLGARFPVDLEMGRSWGELEPISLSG